MRVARLLHIWESSRTCPERRKLSKYYCRPQGVPRDQISGRPDTLSSVYKQPKELTTSLCCLNFSKIWLVLLLIRCLNFVMSITLKSFKKQFPCQIKLGIHREFMKNKPRMHIIIAFSSKLGGSAEWQQINLWSLKKVLLSSKKLN